jgi:hypothetical protein
MMFQQSYYCCVCAPTSLSDQCICVQACHLSGMASKDLCMVCGKPFYGKQKSIWCGESDALFHCNCIQTGVTDITVSTSTGKSTYKCDSCKQFMGDSAVEHSVIKGDQKGGSSKVSECSDLRTDGNDSLSAQLEAIV